MMTVNKVDGKFSSLTCWISCRYFAGLSAILIDTDVLDTPHRSRRALSADQEMRQNEGLVLHLMRSTLFDEIDIALW